MFPDLRVILWTTYYTGVDYRNDATNYNGRPCRKSSGYNEQ